MGSYIILRNSVEQAAWLTELSDHPSTPSARVFKGHKFPVVMGGWKPIRSKRSAAEETIGGVLDVSVGHIWVIANYTVRVKHALYVSEDANYGLKSDIDSLFDLNNPTGTPSNLIYLVDHYEVDTANQTGVPGYLLGDHSPEPLTMTIVGEEAHYLVPIMFRAAKAVGVA